MRSFRMTVEYDGTEFAGFQVQLEHRSVQAELERALEKLTRQAVRVHGAGRTDAGVHALGQVIGFRCETRIPLERLPDAMNGVLSRDISVRRAAEVDERFHARFSAISRAYAYLILNRPHRSALFGRYTYHCPQPMDLEAMRAGARHLVGTHDFSAWANGTDETNSTVRHVIRCGVRPVGSLLLIHVEANAFLRGMVRNIVGTLVQVGAGKRQPDEMRQITESQDRAQAGPTAPAQGLTLVRVRY